MENLRLCCLRIAKVHHFVKQLVDDDKVVPYRLLLELLKVFCKDLDEPVEEEENFGGIGVAFGEGEDIEIAVTNVEVLFQEASCQRLPIP